MQVSKEASGKIIINMNKIIIPLGLTDDNELISLTYGHNSVQNSTNVLLEGGPASGRQELIYNMMYSLLTNYSSKEILIYDVCSGKEWTYTVRHFRNVRIAYKGDTMVSFLEFILREVNDREGLEIYYSTQSIAVDTIMLNLH